MTVITVQAADSAEAMEKVLCELGEDALILSTRSRDGLFEIVATDDPLPSPKCQANAPERKLEPSLPKGIHEEIGETSNVLPFGRRWRQAIEDFERATSTSPLGKRDAADGEQISEQVLASRRVLLYGPVGAGKSQLALQIAVQRTETDQQTKTSFVFCGSGSHCDGAYLSNKAWLLQVPMRFEVPETLRPSEDQSSEIIVVSGNAKKLPDIENAIGLLVLPAGLRREHISRAAQRYQGRIAGIIFTYGAGIGEPTGEDFDAASSANLPMIWISQRESLINALRSPQLFPLGAKTEPGDMKAKMKSEDGAKPEIPIWLRRDKSSQIEPSNNSWQHAAQAGAHP